MCFGTLYNTTINFNGHSIRSSYNSLSPFGCCSFNSFSPGCFGYGFGCGGGNSFMTGAGIGLGFAAGMAVLPALPAIFKGIGKGCSWLWNNTIAPIGKGIGNCCNWLWNKAIAPAGKGIANVAVGAWNGIKAVGNWIGKGCKNLWNKMFHRKSTKAE